MATTHLITGAFGFTGRYIAELLLAKGQTVRTLTHSPRRRNSFGTRVAVFPLAFDRPDLLREAMDGVDVLYNTYWVRFSKAGFSQDEAVRNTQALFEAAQGSGVGRIVHVSILNPSADSPYEYYRGKAQNEQCLVASGLPHTILRPAVFFGHEDILVNNIAWMLRRFPVFGIFGDGKYRIRPICVADFAELAVREGVATGNRCIDAVGPVSFSYRELVTCIAQAIGVKRPLLNIPPLLGLGMGALVGLAVGDVVLTKEEIAALMDSLLDSDAPATGTTHLSSWARDNAETLGRKYASELARRHDRSKAYSEL